MGFYILIVNNTYIVQNNKKSKKKKNLKSERILRRSVNKALTKNTYILLDFFCVFFLS